MKRFLAILLLTAYAAMGQTYTNQFDNVVVTTNLIVSNNLIVVNGTISGSTQISGTNLSFAAPILTNAFATASNGATISLTISNLLGTNITINLQGGTNPILFKLWRGGTEVWDYGIWDNTNDTFTIRDTQSGVNALSISNTTETATFAGNIVTKSNIYIPTTGWISFGTYPFISSYGSGNFFAGANSGNFTMTGTGNVGIGSGSMNTLTSGGQNAAYGFLALGSITSGSFNVAYGENALGSVTTTSNNVAVGQNAGGNVTGYNNTLLGYQAGWNLSSGNYDIDIGNTGVYGESGIIRLGTPGTQTDTYLSGTVHEAAIQSGGSSVSAPMETFTNNYVPANVIGQWQGQAGQTNFEEFMVAGTTNFTFAAASNTFALLDSNGAPAVTVTNLTHSIGFHGNVNFDSNVVIPSGSFTGTAAGATNANATLLFGSGTVPDTYLGANLAGWDAIPTNGLIPQRYSFTYYDYFVGLYAGNLTMTGSDNVAFGYNTLNNGTTGSWNTEVGAQGLFNTTTGSFNTALGGGALFGVNTGSNNIGVGYQAGYNLTTGTNNIDIGNVGAATDTNTIRIGTGQTAAYIAGTVSGANGFSSQGTNSLVLTGFTAWTNTNAFSVTLYYTNGVTNLCLSNSTPFLLFRNTTNSGLVPIHMPQNFIVTNASASAVAVQE